MKNKFLSVLVIFCLGLVITIKAQNNKESKGEGMWLPIVLEKMHEDKMKQKGMEIDAKTIYDVNNASIKDAIIRLNGGSCTAEVVSGNGLLFTNHHCAYDMISKHSTEENNYLENGFWAENQEEEIPNENFTASRLVKMKDVTDAVAPVLDTVDKRSRRNVKQKLYDSLKKAATEGTHFNASIETMYHNNEYYLMVYETFKDIRLVGAPSSDIGKFGGDTDNWTWPRHTGDFAVLRIYTGPNGMPAEYSEDNKPYNPKHHLPISLNGYEKGDFSMIMGFPGNTDRYLTSYAIKHKMEQEEPTIINVWDALLTNMENKMEESEEAKLKLASLHAAISNYHKYYKGQLKGLKDYDLVGKKREKEKKFMQWVNKKEKRKEKYGEVLSKIKKQYDLINRVSPGYYYYRYGFRFVQSIRYANRFNQFRKQLASLASSNASKEKIEKAVESFRKRSAKFFGDSYIGMQKATLRDLLPMYGKNVPPEQRPDFFNNLIESHPGQSVETTVDNYLDNLFQLPAKKRQDLIGYGIRLHDLGEKMAKMGSENGRLDSMANLLKQDILTYFRNVGSAKAKDQFKQTLVEFVETTPQEERPDVINKWLAEAESDDKAKVVADQVEKMFNKGFLFGDQTILVDSTTFKDNFEDPDPELLKEDPLIKVARNLEGYDQLRQPSLVFDSAKTMKFLENPDPWRLKNEAFLNFGSKMSNYFRRYYGMQFRRAKSEINDEMTLYMEGLRKWKDDKVFYPNANSTMRANYGEVEPYTPEDAVFYDFFTTHQGILEKKDPKDEEFDVPGKLDKLIKEEDFGRYGVGDTLKLCFLTDNDITGGNSGSPVINAKGHLMGIAFDGNWESMTGDLVVDESVNRTINVDIRYVLFVIDKVAESDYIMKELDIVGKNGKPQSKGN